MSELLNREAAEEAIMHLQLKPRELASIVDEVLTAALGGEPLYRIDSSSNDWDELGVIDADGESLGVLVQINPEGEQL